MTEPTVNSTTTTTTTNRQKNDSVAEKAEDSSIIGASGNISHLSPLSASQAPPSNSNKSTNNNNNNNNITTNNHGTNSPATTTSQKIILRLKRKRNDDFHLEEFYLPEKRRRMDVLMDQFHGMNLRQQSLGEGNSRNNDDDDTDVAQQKTSSASGIASKLPDESSSRNNSPFSFGSVSKLEEQPSSSKPVNVSFSKVSAADSVKTTFSSNGNLKEGEYSFARFRLLEKGQYSDSSTKKSKSFNSIKQLSIPTQSTVKRKKLEQMTNNRKNRRLVKLKEKRENNVKIIDIEFEREGTSQGKQGSDSDDDFVYDIFVREQVMDRKPEQNGFAPIIESFIYGDEDDEFNPEEMYDHEYDTDDSNAEDHYLNDYGPGYCSDTDEQSAYATLGEEYPMEPDLAQEDASSGEESSKHSYGFTSFGAKKGIGGLPDRYSGTHHHEPDTDLMQDEDAFSSEEGPFQNDSYHHRNGKLRTRYDDEDETDEEELMDFLDMVNDREQNAMR